MCAKVHAQLLKSPNLNQIEQATLRQLHVETFWRRLQHRQPGEGLEEQLLTALQVLVTFMGEQGPWCAAVASRIFASTGRITCELVLSEWQVCDHAVGARKNDVSMPQVRSPSKLGPWLRTPWLHAPCLLLPYQGLTSAVATQQHELTLLAQQLLGAAGGSDPDSGSRSDSSGAAAGTLAAVLVGLLPRYRTLVGATLQSTAPLSITGAYFSVES